MIGKAKCRWIKLAYNLLEPITFRFNWNSAILFNTSGEDYFASLVQDEEKIDESFEDFHHL